MRKVFMLLLAAFVLTGTAQTAQASEVAKTTSFSVSISVSKSSITLGQSVKLTGKVTSPKAARKKVKIQRRYDGGSWKTIRTVKLSRKSTYSYTVRPSRGGPTSYRVQKPASNGRSTTTSSTRRVDVFRWRSLLGFPLSSGYVETEGTRTITGQAFPASAAVRGGDFTWLIEGARCSSFRSFIGIDDTSLPGLTASPTMFWDNGLPTEKMIQNTGQNDNLVRGQNPRHLVEPVPAGTSTYKLFPVLSGLPGATDFLTLGTPQMYCNS